MSDGEYWGSVWPVENDLTVRSAFDPIFLLVFGHVVVFTADTCVVGVGTPEVFPFDEVVDFSKRGRYVTAASAAVGGHKFGCLTSTTGKQTLFAAHVYNHTSRIDDNSPDVPGESSLHSNIS